MGEHRLTSEGGYSVIVISLAGYDSAEELSVTGFPTPEIAIEYARRRTRDSLEELRSAGGSNEELRRLWSLFGEDCIVIGRDYNGASEIDYFIVHPATESERDWKVIEDAVRRSGGAWLHG